VKSSKTKEHEFSKLLKQSDKNLMVILKKRHLLLFTLYKDLNNFTIFFSEIGA